ncbi:MAG: N-acetylmuramoyl-L-alanine amidase [Eubacterium sp.]|jgi:N-acetylmuramoyl-L-alanine amidase|nr:N-acetylmuramoyl-L-alanine amidase [Eubacterium sp.]
MNLKQFLLTKNDCYKSGQKHKVKGFMLHSTGADNPNLRRYVQPDDGLLGANLNGNDWNRSRVEGGVQMCCHGFIGKLKDGSVATYQTLPWDVIGWHCGGGDLKTAQKNGFGKNSANFLGYIGIEICEDGLDDEIYFNKIYKESTELCAHLCEKYNIKPEKPFIIDHKEGNALGIASAHADVEHWFSKHGKNMKSFRDDVKRLLDSRTSTESKAKTKYKVQLGSFEVKSNAERLRKILKEAGFPDAYIKEEII